MSDWNTAVRKPPSHRVNKNGSSDSSSGDCLGMGRATFFCIFVLLVSFGAMLAYMPNERDCRHLHPGSNDIQPYNDTYPLTLPIESESEYKYRIAVVTDLDLNTKLADVKNTWRSIMRKGYLTVSKDQKRASVSWDQKTINLKSTLAQGGRSMELSDLKVFDGHLLTVDDRTGVVYKIINDKPIVWVILNDGDGNEAKGFKGEWMTVKDKMLYVGGLGKEWTTTQGEFVNNNPMYIKTVSYLGYVKHIDWRQVYIDVRAAAGIHYPGYMIHESAQWSDIHRKWFFLPRRASTETYTEESDEHRATNLMIIGDEDLQNFEVRKIGDLQLTKGFSAFQFVPNTNDNLIVALKTEEDQGTINSYIMMFDVHGKFVLPETKLEGDYKFEGIDFI